MLIVKRIHHLATGLCPAKFSECAMDIRTHSWYNYLKSVWKCLLPDAGEVNILKLKMNMQAIKPAVIAALAAVVVVSPLAVRADASITLTGSRVGKAQDYSYTATSDTTINLNGVNFKEAKMKLAAQNDAAITYTINLVDGTQNIFSITNRSDPCIKATKNCSIKFTGGGSLDLTNEEDFDGTEGVLTCRNLTVTSGDIKVEFDNDKDDSPCIYLKGNYLQTGGKVKVESAKKNCTNELVGVHFDNANTTFTLEDGTFNAEIAGTKSKAISLKKSGKAYFKGGKCKVEFEGPKGKFVDGGNIYVQGGEFNLTTNITSKMTAAYYPTEIAAFKPDDSIEFTGGDFEVDIPLVGSEFVDAATNVTVSAGTFDIVSGNDCFHAAKYIYINGGRIHAVSTGDDALDANKGIRIYGGDIRAYATAEAAHGLDVNDDDKLVIAGGTVIATDGLDAVRIGDKSKTVGDVDFQQDTYYGTLSTTGFSGKYLYLEGQTNNVPFVVKPCLPAFPAGRNFNLLVSVPGRTASVPEAKTAEEAYSDRSSHNPMVFEKKATVDDHTVTTKDGSTISVPAWYDLLPTEGKTKTVTLSLNDLATPAYCDGDKDGIEAISIEGNVVSVGVKTLAGLKYTLRGTENVATAYDLWPAVGETVSGDGSAKALTATAGEKGFFKVSVTD